MSKTEYIATLESRIDNLNEELNAKSSEINNLINRLVEKTVEYYEDNDSCMEGTVDFLSEVIGGLRTKEWIISHFSRSFQLSASFTITGSNADAAYDITFSDIEDFIKTYFENYNSKVEIDNYDVSEDR